MDVAAVEHVAAEISIKKQVEYNEAGYFPAFFCCLNKTILFIFIIFSFLLRNTLEKIKIICTAL